jgi:hypothetical protein
MLAIEGLRGADRSHLRRSNPRATPLKGDRGPAAPADLACVEYGPHLPAGR